MEGPGQVGALSRLNTAVLWHAQANRINCGLEGLLKKPVFVGKCVIRETNFWPAPGWVSVPSGVGARDCRHWLSLNRRLTLVGVFVGPIRPRWSRAAAQQEHCLQRVAGDESHESLTVHLPQSSSCLAHAHTSSDLGYNRPVLVRRYYSALPRNFCRNSDHFRLTYAMLDRGSSAGIGELPDIRSVHCGTNCGINGKRSSKSCLILSPRAPA